MKRRSPCAVASVLLILLLFAATPSAFAHAVLVRSYPADGSIVHTRNVEIALVYDSRIDVRRSTISLTTANGHPVSLQIEHSGKPFELKAVANGLSNGRYAMHWQVLASDGHITRGDVVFTVDIK